MKFGNHFDACVILEWKNKYLEYGKLKKIIKSFAKLIQLEKDKFLQDLKQGINSFSNNQEIPNDLITRRSLKMDLKELKVIDLENVETQVKEENKNQIEIFQRKSLSSQEKFRKRLELNDIQVQSPDFELSSPIQEKPELSFISTHARLNLSEREWIFDKFIKEFRVQVEKVDNFYKCKLSSLQNEIQNLEEEATQQHDKLQEVSVLEWRYQRLYTDIYRNIK